jgi:hypothetical protein
MCTRTLRPILISLLLWRLVCAEFPIGSDVTVLVGIQNNGKDDFNMSYIGASLHNPFDLAYHIQNVCLLCTCLICALRAVLCCVLVV